MQVRTGHPSPRSHRNWTKDGGQVSPWRLLNWDALGTDNAEAHKVANPAEVLGVPTYLKGSLRSRRDPRLRQKCPQVGGDHRVRSPAVLEIEIVLVRAKPCRSPIARWIEVLVKSNEG